MLHSLGNSPLGIGLFAVALVSCGLAPWEPARADGTPNDPPNHGAVLLANPADTMDAIARHFDKDPNVVVLKVEGLPITQGDAADVIRSMPVSLASLGMPEVYRRAIDVLIRQKAMVLNARRQGLDKDPAVIHGEQVAAERVQADAWLNRKADTAVTEEALHARYDRDVAGRPGPDEVRARVILVTTTQEARSLIASIRDGADFVELARKVSKDPTAPAGGDLGYLPLESVAPEVGSAMFSLSPGEMTPYPVHSLAGYFVVRVEGRRQRATPTFDEARGKLEHELRGEAVRQAIASLLSDVKLAPAEKPGSP